MGGRKSKQVLSIVASIAIPFAAPAIASSIAASGALGASIAAAGTSTALTAATGAVLGAVKATVFDEDVAAGAITGGVGAGVKAFSLAKSGINTSGAIASGLGPAPGAIPSTDFIGGNSAGLSVGNAAGQAGAQQGFLASVKQVPGEILSRFNDPKTLARATVEVGAQLAGTLLAPSISASPEEEAAIAAYKQDLQTLRTRDEQAYNQRLALAQQYIQQAEDFDPTQYAQQEAARQRTTVASANRDDERRNSYLGPRYAGAQDAARRRGDLNEARSSATGYAQGLRTGFDKKNALFSTASGLVPNAPTGILGSSNQFTTSLSKNREERNKIAQTQRNNISARFGTFFFDDDDDEEKKTKKPQAGLNTTTT